MLIGYTIKGFLSFKNETTIDLTPTNYKILANENIYNNVLKGTMLIGGNASGKSNTIHAVRLLLELLFAKHDVNLQNYLCIFSEDNDLELTYRFLIDDNRIEYKIKYQKIKKIITENLFLNNKEILNRIGTNAESNINETTIYDNISNDTLFLRDIYFNTKFRANEVLKKWFDFLINSVYADMYYRSIQIFKDSKIKLSDYLEENGVGKINNFFNKYNFNQRIEYADKAKGNIVSIETPEENTVFFRRNGIGEPIPFPLESLGNRNLLMLLPVFFHTLQNGGILILDEFSSGFHNELEELLVKYFMENAKNAQLIFVSHSTNLLDNSLLRPDQMYTVEFVPGQGSVINRISKEQPREAQNIEKMYLGGVFGGLPNYTDTNQ